MFHLIPRFRSCSRLLAFAMLATFTFYGAFTRADGSLVVRTFDYPPSSGCTNAETPMRGTDKQNGNQYVLLLFFKQSEAVAVHKVLQTVPAANPSDRKDG